MFLALGRNRVASAPCMVIGVGSRCVLLLFCVETIKEWRVLLLRLWFLRW